MLSRRSKCSLGHSVEHSDNVILVTHADMLHFIQVQYENHLLFVYIYLR